MFQLGNKEYSLNQLNLKQSIEILSLNQQEPTFHTSVIHKNSLYHYAWPDTCSVLRLQNNLQKNQRAEPPTQIKLDKESFSNFNISDYTFCYGSAILNNQIHLLVSKNQSKPESSQIPAMIKLNLVTGIYSEVSTSGYSPSFRTGSLVESISNMYVLVYGGTDLQSNLPYSDAYALIFWEWNKLKIVNPIEPRTNFASTIVNTKLYLHGGQVIRNDQKTYLSDLYEITFSETKKELIFQQIPFSEGPIPTPRSNHKMTSISQRYLVTFGGVCEDKNNQGSQGTIGLKEVWMFDLLERKWIEIQIEMQKFKFHSLYSFSSHLNELFIFGAFQNVKSNKKSDMIRLQFAEKFDKRLVSSSSQIMNTRVKESLEGSCIEFATSFIHSSSYLIKFPFQAIQRIIEFGESQNASTIKIYSEFTTNTIDKFIYISIDIKTTQEMEPLNDLEIKVQKLFVYCLRMGKTALYVQNYKKTGERKVYLMSADGKFAPLLQRLQLFYSYTQCSNDSGLLSVQNSRNKQIIHSILQGLIDDPQSTIRSIQGGKIMIFMPNIIPTPKSYFYELVFDSLLDISLFKNNKKLELLDKVNYDLGSSMQFSLHSYLKYSNTNKTTENNQKKPQIFLSKSVNPVPQDRSYADYLEEISKQGTIVKLNFPINSHLKHVDSYDLYACQQDFYLPQNNGILLYQNGQLVNRYECQFGKLLQDKFYHKKIQRQAKNIFIVAGQIHLSSRLGLINFNTEFQKTNKFIEFQLSLQTLVTNFLQKMTFTPKITKNNLKNAKNTSQQNQNASIDSNGHQSKSNQVIPIESQNELSQKRNEEQSIQEQSNHKKLKLDNQVQKFPQN